MHPGFAIGTICPSVVMFPAGTPMVCCGGVAHDISPICGDGIPKYCGEGPFI